MKNILYILFLIFSCSVLGQDNVSHDTNYLYLIRDTVTYDKYGYVDSKGDTVVPFNKYAMCYTDTIRQFGVVLLDGKGFFGIDNKDSILFEIFSYDNGPDEASEGLFRIIKNGKIGFANLKGQIVIEPQYDCAESFKKGIAKVSADCAEIKDGEHTSWMSDNWYLIDNFGIEIDWERCASNCPEFAFADNSLTKSIYYCADSIPFEDISQRFMTEIISNLKIDSLPYPIETRGQIRFIIDTDGNIIRPLIYYSISADIDRQILELILKWGNLPIGYCQGYPVPVLIIIPFQIDYN